MKILLTVFFFYCLYHGALAQTGCQDPLAINFNPTTIQTDTSCHYPLTNVSTSSRIPSLPASIPESSALLLTDGKLFTLNDSGNTPDIFQLDSTTGAILKKTTISNFTNIDWEELAADSQFLYVGDFGNNSGNRTNLRILKLRKTALYHPDSISVPASRLSFTYPDQTNFNSSGTHNFDCEAFFYFNGLLHLFTKNRGNQKTNYYTLDPTLATQQAILKDSLNVKGLITAASIRPDGKAAILLGYGNGNAVVFTWLLFGYQGSDFFGGNRRRLELPNALTSGQAEGICFAPSDRIWVSNEKVSFVPAAVRQFSFKPFITPFFTPILPDIKKSSIQVFMDNNLEIISINGLAQNQVMCVSGMDGKKIYEGNTNAISTHGWKPGIYQVLIPESKNGKLFNQRILIH